ncbi:MAG: hypothetical protein AB7K24_05190 [Gemmataceae bacterium]
MSGSFQQQSRLRKLIYFALIVGLFSATLVLRRQVIETRAEELALREHHLGDVELTGSAVNLMLTGSRGVVVCYLWNVAIEKQKKHEWNQLELYVNQLTKMQPHFIRPWQFQSWNLAYNVSVESDRIKDKYFYIARGIEMLNEGVQRNRDNPDLRFDAGIFYQNKIGIADENHTLRSLFQLSSIDPKDRDPARLRRRVAGREVVDYEAFKSFCQLHPQLIRRLRTIPDSPCDTPEKVLYFLEENRRIPSLYQDEVSISSAATATPLKPVGQRFPVLPPRSRFDPDELTYESQLADEHDNFVAARAWFGYAQDPVEYLKRKPRMIAKVIFQSYPGRAQFYHADRLKDEGWFDRAGWTITDWFPVDPGQPYGDKQPVVVGDRRDWGMDAWKKAHELYRRHGEEHGLLFTPEVLAAFDSEEMREYNYKHQVSNFDHFYFRSGVEQTKEGVEAAKHFFLAEQYRRQADNARALAMYEHPAAFGPPGTWQEPTGLKKLFLENPGFRDDKESQRDIMKLQMRYLKLLDQVRGPLLRKLALITPAAMPPVPLALANAVQVPTGQLARRMDLTVHGPFDGLDPTGRPLINPEIRHEVSLPSEPHRPTGLR